MIDTISFALGVAIGALGILTAFLVCWYRSPLHGFVTPLYNAIPNEYPEWIIEMLK